MTKIKGKTNARPAIFVPDFSTLQPKMQDKFRVKIEEFAYVKVTPHNEPELQSEKKVEPLSSKEPEKIKEVEPVKDFHDYALKEEVGQVTLQTNETEIEVDDENEIKPNPKLVNEFITLLTSTPSSKMPKTFMEDAKSFEGKPNELDKPLLDAAGVKENMEDQGQEVTSNNEVELFEVEDVVEEEPEVNAELKSLIRRLAVFPHVLQRPNCEAVINGETKIIRVLSKRGDHVRIQSADGIDTVNIKEIEELKVLIDNN